MQTVSLWSVLLLAFRPLIRFLEEKCHSLLSGKMLVNILRCICSRYSMSIRKMGDVRLQQFLTILIFLHCHGFAFTIIRTASETFALPSLEFLGKDLNVEH